MIPARTGDRFFVALLIFDTVYSLAIHEWWAALGWAGAATGWWYAIMVSEIRAS